MTDLATIPFTPVRVVEADRNVLDYATLMSDGPDWVIPETLSDFTTAFNQSLGRTVREIIYRGMLCIAAKRKFPGEYERWIKNDLKCSRGYAYKCKVIADNKFLANASSWKHLPPSVAALYELSRISAERLAIFKEGGELHAKLKIHEAVELAEAEQDDSYRPKKKKERPAPAQQLATVDEDDDPSNTDDGSENADYDAAEDVGAEGVIIDADDIIEAFAETFARNRSKIEHVRQHGDRTARGLLADQLRDLIAKLERYANELGGDE